MMFLILKLCVQHKKNALQIQIGVEIAWESRLIDEWILMDA